MIEGRFLDWLERSGRNRATARNIKSSVNRARRLLGGRKFAEVALEIAALDAAPGFDALPKGTRSDLRQALRLYSEFLASKKTKTKRPDQNMPLVEIEERLEMAEAA